MISISRVQKACEKESFLTKVFSCKEIELYRKCPEKLAANFSSKEAFSKALGTGLRGFDMNEVELLRDSLGKPYYEFSGRALGIMNSHKLVAHVSVSDEEDYVIVFTVLETEE